MGRSFRLVLGRTFSEDNDVICTHIAVMLASTAVTRSWTGDWTGVRPWGDGHCAVAFRKVCLLVGDGTVDRLPCCCPGEDSRRVCSRWLREIDICELQGCWSAAPALCADAVRQVDFAQLWSRREVEARPSSAWAEPTSSVCRPWVPRTAWRRPWWLW